MPTPNSLASARAIRSAVSALGPVFNTSVLMATRDIYRPHIARHEPPMPTLCDIEWGRHERQKLDLYRPVSASDAPVVVFVHGGGFVAGSKDEDGSFHRNVGEYFARNGFVTVLPNYRLAPDCPWPAGAEDVGAVLAWTRDNVAQHGGKPGAVVVVAQSAGASHTATWLFDDGLRAGREPGVCGAALLSGFYRPVAPLTAGPLSYFGSDASLYATRSVTERVRSGHPPLLLTLAEFDPASIAVQTFDFARQLSLADGRPPQLLWFEGHNHVSTVQSLGSPQDDVGQALLRFVRACSQQIGP